MVCGVGVFLVVFYDRWVGVKLLCSGRCGCVLRLVVRVLFVSVY